MSGFFYSLITLVFVLFFVSFPVFAQTINEICPVASDGYPYEWVEVYNDSDSPISTENLKITDETNKTLKWQSNEVPPHGYALATSSSILNNDGDTVYIKDSSGNVIISQNYLETFGANMTYTRCDNGGRWIQTSFVSPLADNEQACFLPTATSVPTNTNVPQNDTSITPSVDYNNIYISEVMAYSETESNEWIELFNNNSFEVRLIDWQIDDELGGGSSPFKFSLTIPAYGYGSFDITRSIFNNDQDVVRLLNTESLQKDSIKYSSSEKNKSIGKPNIFSSSVCVQLPSRNVGNYQCISDGNSSTKQNQTSAQILTPTFSANSLENKIATDGQNLASVESHFSLPKFFGSIKGIATRKNVISPKKVDKKQLKTAASFAATSFMFSWANIFYILFKLRGKYKEFYEKSLN
ncbi:hypothetical protein A2690_03260 [Candidatus Roizmanbacteria bacterium RIFCSPHIGHO2_01_FULL_39_12b]|uniref:LTD domain-containing protein n=1 Tax=Candidatus Roizmanbacteria bacterium RIFCSPHIGHO2_01_FULL_39_12b TaxID=1802030 RepID=A0A1F7GCI6_9BACT|nr:MAG: hypothetical protein A2690_03260 [Candidatus Roizmanbacteria bacterium RIFCSPHIGHO2_01_FULL_39_12b]OGK46683.1 MAG: hypothetical protein A3B46_02515 [Candidatus Roizmanbacteria bacterium RIFCSPLOWO2_01_FULL_39_19]